MGGAANVAHDRQSILRRPASPSERGESSRGREHRRPAGAGQVDPGRHPADDDRGRLGASQQLAVGRRGRDGAVFRRVPAHDPKNPHWPDRDRFILSKGHAAPVLYAALAQSGYFPHDEIMTLRKIGSPVEGHPNMRRLAGVEASTGSLGQGLSIGIGHALAARVDKKAITPTS